jgi:hypothetical protein
MTGPRLDQFLMGFGWSGDRATTEELAAVELVTGIKLPADLIEVLVSRGAGEGQVGAHARLRLWPLADWLRINGALEASTNWPGLVLFGEDGGGGFYGLDNGGTTYVRVEDIGDRDRERLGSSLEDFFTYLASISG